MADLNDLGEKIANALTGAVKDKRVANGELTLDIEAAEIARVVKSLRDDFDFTVLIDICGVDWPQRTKRFDVVYHFLSLKQNARVRLKVQAGEDTAVPSIVSLHRAAGWFERETFDMYGVVFDGNPDMRRLLTDYGFSGYPLRKDFPLTGFVELRYDDELKRVVYRPVKLVQEFRDFDFMSPWEGAPHILPGDEKASGDAGKKP